MLSAISLEAYRWFESFSLKKGWRRVKRSGGGRNGGQTATPREKLAFLLKDGLRCGIHGIRRLLREDQARIDMKMEVGYEQAPSLRSPSAHCAFLPRARPSVLPHPGGSYQRFADAEGTDQRSFRCAVAHF